MNLQPLGNRVIVRPDVPEEKSVGGIIIPEMAKEPPTTGTVVAIGDECEYQALTVGMKVAYSRHGGQFVSADDGDVLIMAPKDILAIVRPVEAEVAG